MLLNGLLLIPCETKVRSDVLWVILTDPNTGHTRND